MPINAVVAIFQGERFIPSLHVGNVMSTRTFVTAVIATVALLHTTEVASLSTNHQADGVTLGNKLLITDSVCLRTNEEGGLRSHTDRDSSSKVKPTSLADSYGCQSGILCRLRRMRPTTWLSRVGTGASSIALEVLEAIYERRWYCDHSTQIIFHDGDIIAYRVIESTGCFWKGHKAKWLRKSVSRSPLRGGQR